MQKCVARAAGVGSSGVPLCCQVISQEAKKSMPGRAGASILVSLAQALEFLFKVEERPAKGLNSWQGSDQKEWAVFL